MNNEILVVGWEGYGASSRKDSKTLSKPIMELIQERTENTSIRFHEVASNDKEDSMEEVKKMLQLINPKYALFVGKSYGGVRIKQFLEEYYDDLLKNIHYHILFIDPHGAMAGDGEVGPYSDKQPMKLDDKLIPDATLIRCIYQHNDKPTGAEVLSKNVVNVKLEGEYDHYNIIGAPEVRTHLNQLLNEF